MSGYNKRALEEGIRQCQKNIRTFKEAIENERRTMDEYQGYINVINEKEKLKKKMEKDISVE